MPFFLFLFAVSYFVPLVRCTIKFFQHRRALDVLTNFVTRYSDLSNSGWHPDPKEYKKELTALLRYYPVIEKFAPSPGISYSQQDDDIYRHAKDLIGKLQMSLNRCRHELISRLNPLLSLQDIVLLPVSVVRALGFAPGKAASLFITVFVWVVQLVPDSLWAALLAHLVSLIP